VKAGRFGLFEDFVCSSEAVTPTACNVNDSSRKITTNISNYWKNKKVVSVKPKSPYQHSGQSSHVRQAASFVLFRFVHGHR
jgi:hypothetical protein